MEVISERYPDLSAIEATQLYDIAAGGSRAGQFLNTLSADQPFPLEVIPIQRSLFGVEPLGRRLLVAAEISNQQTGESIEVREPIDPLSTIGDMLRYLQSLLDAWSDQSPDLAEALQLEKDTLLDQFFLFAERRF